MKKRYTDGIVPATAKEARSEIAKQLKACRLSCEMTQESLAKLCDTDKSNISRMESGVYNPTIDFLVKVADSMGKEISISIA